MLYAEAVIYRWYCSTNNHFQPRPRIKTIDFTLALRTESLVSFFLLSFFLSRGKDIEKYYLKNNRLCVVNRGMSLDMLEIRFCRWLRIVPNKLQHASVTQRGQHSIGTTGAERASGNTKEIQKAARKRCDTILLLVPRQATEEERKEETEKAVVKWNISTA